MLSHHSDFSEHSPEAIASDPALNPESLSSSAIDADSKRISSDGNTFNTSSNSDRDRSLAAYDYKLPEDRIAQNPVVPRDRSRLLVVNSPTTHQHHEFRDLSDLLQPGDLLVLNNTRVMPARLYGCKSTGAPVEVLLLEEKPDNTWFALVKPGKRLKPGAQIFFWEKGERGMGNGEWGMGNGERQPSPLTPPPSRRDSSRLYMNSSSPALTATVVATDEATGGRWLKFERPAGVSMQEVLARYGHVPLPPYITASAATPEQYQTVYAQESGSAAAPTAGLHFTDELLDRLERKGIDRAFVTLHVGIGTFRPVEVEDVTSHKMHEEWVQVPVETVERIRATKAAGGRIIAVGTTVVRSLEGASTSGELQPFCGKTDLFIYPGYQWRAIDGLITNFHLPRSSLLMLVSALLGRDRLLELYQEAIDLQYRFYSFGDAMLILPEGKVNC